MPFRILGLPPTLFTHLVGLPDAALRVHGAERVVATHKPGFPDRIALRDAEPGESLLLLNFTHQPADTPYRSSHAIFVLEGERAAYDRVDEVPSLFRSRTLSLRAFDAGHRMVDAELAPGNAVEPVIERLLAAPTTAYLQVHYAGRGCYAARIERA